MTLSRYIPFVICGLVALFSSLAFAQGSIQGVVKDNVGNGMESVQVELIVKGAPHTVMTDSEGRYTIANIPKGTYAISFEIDKYKTVKRQVDVPAQGSVAVNALMVPEETVGVIQLTPAQPERVPLH